MSMKKRSRKIMWTAVCILAGIIIAAIIFFNLPYSRTRSEFNKMIDARTATTEDTAEVFTEEDLVNLPLAVQKYFHYCGYIGTPKMSYMIASFSKVDFKLSDKKTIKIDYIQYNFVEKPERFAFIDSSLTGIPFEGLDSYAGGEGSMKGRFAKLITLFDQRGDEMDKASLVTFLAESFLAPGILLQDYIEWEEVNENQVRATISYYGISASGDFYFNEKGEVTRFETNDRAAVDMNGSERRVKWSAIYSDYQKVNGLRQPMVLKSIWHYPEGDSTYFNENNAYVTVEFH